jgi:hypothetical protein
MFKSWQEAPIKWLKGPPPIEVIAGADAQESQLLSIARDRSIRAQLKNRPGPDALCKSQPD